MDGLIIPILIALTAAFIGWGAVNAFTDEGRGQRRKLSQRLSTESRPAIGPENRPIVLQVEVAGLPAFLATRPFVQTLHRRLLQVYPRLNVPRFFALAVVASVVGTVLAFAFTGAVLITAAAALLGLYLPFFLLGRKCAKRQRQMAEQLPEALDFLSRILKAGHSFSTGLQMMAEELPKPLSEEFRRCYDQHSLGQALEDSLRETAVRVESTDFAFFVTALLIQRQTGGDLSEVLKNISQMIRGRVRLAQQVRSKTAEGRLTGYILVAFPAVMFFLVWIQNPEQAGKMLRGTGLYLLGLAFALQMLGLFTIRKITTVKV